LGRWFVEDHDAQEVLISDALVGFVLTQLVRPLRASDAR
jgi:hypothetical protein